MRQQNALIEVLGIFRNMESHFGERSEAKSNRLIFSQLMIITAFGFLYGVLMGSYHGLIQSLVAGIKINALWLLTIIICFPSVFVIQQVLGSKLSLKQMMIIVLSGLVLSSAIAISFSPIVVLFQLTGSNYHFLQLLHVSIFVFAGIFGMRVMINALKYACEKKSIYPQVGVTVFKIWIIILAFVAIQLAWNLRPFVGEKDDDFQLFRDYEGNFYTAIIYSVQQLGSRDVPEARDAGRSHAESDKTEVAPVDTTYRLIER